MGGCMRWNIPATERYEQNPTVHSSFFFVFFLAQMRLSIVLMWVCYRNRCYRSSYRGSQFLVYSYTQKCKYQHCSEWITHTGISPLSPSLSPLSFNKWKLFLRNSCINTLERIARISFRFFPLKRKRQNEPTVASRFSISDINILRINSWKSKFFIKQWFSLQLWNSAVKERFRNSVNCTYICNIWRGYSVENAADNNNKKRITAPVKCVA